MQKVERKLIFDGSPCDVNFYEGGPTTCEQARELGREDQICPWFGRCEKELHQTTGHMCTMKMGVEVARNTLNERWGVDREMEDFQTFLRQDVLAPKGFVYSPDRVNFELLTDRATAIERIRAFAKKLLGEPEGGLQPTTAGKVGSSFGALVSSATDPEDGTIDLRKIDQHEGRFGSNAGRPCDVQKGPCSCGAWH